MATLRYSPADAQEELHAAARALVKEWDSVSRLPESAIDDARRAVLFRLATESLTKLKMTRFPKPARRS